MRIEIKGEGVTLRQVAQEDLALLLAILRTPEVAERWAPPSEDDDEFEFLRGEGAADNETVTTFTIFEAERIVGWIASCELNEPDMRHAGIDIFLAPDVHGRGLGPAAIRTLAAWLFDKRGHHRIVIDPAASNTKAVRAYEKVGFCKVGVMRQYERGADGFFHDGVLLDLLRGDLR